MKKIITIIATIALIAGCGQKGQVSNATEQQANSEQSSAQQADSTKPSSQSEEVSLDDIKSFISWDMNIMSVTKEADGYLLTELGSPLRLHLQKQADGTYRETTKKKEMIGQGAQFRFTRVGDVVTLTATDQDGVFFTMIAGDDLKAYRDRGYKRLLTSNFQPLDGHEVKITDTTMKGISLPDNPEMNYFFVENDNGNDLTDIIRLSPGRFHLLFSPADKGVNLHFCNYRPDTGELEKNFDAENTDQLRYAADPGWPWLSTDVLDSGFLIYNFDKPYWKVMLDKLKAKQQPNAVEQWNIQLLEYLIANEEPYSAIESSDV